MYAPRPQLAYQPDTQMHELGTAELFVASALRLWVLPHTDPGNIHPDWRDGFLHAGFHGQGVVAFDTLVRIIATSATRHFEVGCPHCSQLAEDEAWLLQLCGLMQRDRIPEAALILAEWLLPEAVRMAIPPAHVFAHALEARGLTLPYLLEGNRLERWRTEVWATCDSRLVH